MCMETIVLDKASRAPSAGDLVSFQRRQYKITTVWGAGMPGYISITGTGPNPHVEGVTLKAARLAWSAARWGGCWIVLKAA